MLVGAVAAYADPTPSAPDSTPREVQEDWLRPGESITENLPEIAERQGINPDYFQTWFNRTAITPLQVFGRDYGVVVQHYEGPTGVPGMVTQQLVLVTPKGKILDRLRCSVSSRAGDLKAEIQVGAADGAHVVFRFVPLVYPWQKTPPCLSHGTHDIIYDGRLYRFWVAERPEEDYMLPTEWTEPGLCRVQIKEDKFVVLFPKLDNPESKAPRELPEIHLGNPNIKRTHKILPVRPFGAGRDQ
jgi:hypothetical protein